MLLSGGDKLSLHVITQICAAVMLNVIGSHCLGCELNLNVVSQDQTIVLFRSLLVIN